MLVLDLQRFAGEKTEKATPRRRLEARREGRTPRSAELTSALALLAVLVALNWMGPQIWGSWQDMMRTDFSRLTTETLTEQVVIGMFRDSLLMFVKMLAPIIGVALAAGCAVAVAQVGPVFLPKQLAPDFQRVNPFAGLKRIFSARTLVEAAKSVLKLTVVGVVAYMATQGISQRLRDLMATDVATLPSVVGQIVFQVGLQIAVMLLILAFLDFAYQRYEFERSIRMSREDIKEEMKSQELNPKVKSQIMQRGRALAMRRMMQQVPTADVVVTNPTHFSVALKYDASEMTAPVVVAKGTDEVAWRIRKVAEQANVPRVENRPLAQALYKQVDIDQPIPGELFQAVAEVLAYVYRLKQGEGRG